MRERRKRGGRLKGRYIAGNVVGNGGERQGGEGRREREVMRDVDR